MAGLSYGDVSYIQFLKTLNDRINDALDNNDDQNQNTVIQFFDAPYESVNLGATVLVATNTDPHANIVWASSSVQSGWVWDSGTWNPTVNAQSQWTDQLNLAALAAVSTAYTEDMVWGDGSTETYWAWNVGGQWYLHPYNLTLWPVVLDELNSTPPAVVTWNSVGSAMWVLESAETWSMLATLN
jgi:hypothetical protein